MQAKGQSTEGPRPSSRSSGPSVSKANGRVTERLGVRRLFLDITRDVVLFDSVALMTSANPQTEPQGSDAERIATDLEYLAEQGFLMTAPALVNDVEDLWYTNTPEDELDLVFETATALEEGDILLEELAPDMVERVILTRSLSMLRHPSYPDPEGPLPAGCEYLVSLCLRIVDKVDTLPILQRPLSPTEHRLISYMLRGLPDSRRIPRPGPLLEVVIDRLPVPRPDVPLEELLSFARSPAVKSSRDRLLRLVERSEIQKVEAETFALDLEDALAAYRENVEALDRKYAISTLSLVVRSTLGAVEELMHLRPKRAFDELLAYRAIAAERVGAELAAPGREAALIYRVEKGFERRPSV